MFRLSTSQTSWVIQSESGQFKHFIIGNSTWFQGSLHNLRGKS